VLPVYLAEIERSRPYFIGLFDERYDWVPVGDPLHRRVQGRTVMAQAEHLYPSFGRTISEAGVGSEKASHLERAYVNS